MGKVMKEMGNQLPECFYRLQIFLATDMAIPAMNLRITV